MQMTGSEEICHLLLETLPTRWRTVRPSLATPRKAPWTIKSYCQF